jgi:glycosyltransferase involved in cell wall biosynthesis
MEISVIVTNWNRQYFLERIAAQLYTQSFPRDKFEVIFVDDDSEEKSEVLDIFKKIKASCPEMNCKFIETNFCKTQNPAFRYNVGVRNAAGRMLVINESDILQQGDYLSVVYNLLSKDSLAYLSPLVYHVKEAGRLEVENLRMETDLGSAMMREHYEAVHGYDESVSGWGGIEGDFIGRIRQQRGLHLVSHPEGLAVWHHGWNINAKPYFSKKMAQPGTGRRNWQSPQNDNWGISEKIEAFLI